MARSQGSGGGKKMSKFEFARRKAERESDSSVKTGKTRPMTGKYRGTSRLNTNRRSKGK